MEIFSALKLQRTMNVMCGGSESLSVLHGIPKSREPMGIIFFFWHVGLKLLRTVDAKLFGHRVQLYLIMPCDGV
jgi:hypothetical protein